MDVSATDQKVEFGDPKNREPRTEFLKFLGTPKPLNHQIDTKILMSIRAASIGLKQVTLVATTRLTLD